MFSLAFFLFVAFILVIGFFAMNWRRKNRVPLDPDTDQKGSTGQSSHSKSAFNEPLTGDSKGGIVRTNSKLSQNDFDEENPATK